jgi:hypothetical protein
MKFSIRILKWNMSFYLEINISYVRLILKRVIRLQIKKISFKIKDQQKRQSMRNCNPGKLEIMASIIQFSFNKRKLYFYNNN